MELINLYKLIIFYEYICTMSVGSGCAEGAEQAVYGSYDTGNFKGNSLFESCPGYCDIVGHVAWRSIGHNTESMA